MGKDSQAKYTRFLGIVWTTLFASVSGRRCPSDGILAGLSGQVSSPRFPEEYPHRISCEWTIIVPRAHHVKIDFTDFDLEYCVFCKCDYVEIRDGRNSTAPLIGKFCQRSKLKTIFSTGRYLWVKFYSDVGGRFQGFRAIYTAKKNGKTFKDLIDVTGPSGLLTSPQSTASCGAARQCTWLVRARWSGHVTLSFYNISLPACSTPCACNTIQVRDGKNASSRLIAEYCETIQRPETMCSMSRHLWVRFTYGPDIDLTKHGFAAKYEETNCGETTETAREHNGNAGTLDTVVGLLCATFTFLALMTFLMVCVASRKLTRDSKQLHSPQLAQAALLPQIDHQRTNQSPPPASWPSCTCDSCAYHTHVHIVFDSETETEYTDEIPRHVTDERTSVYYCRHCEGHLSRPIAIL